MLTAMLVMVLKTDSGSIEMSYKSARAPTETGVALVLAHV